MWSPQLGHRAVGQNYEKDILSNERARSAKLMHRARSKIGREVVGRWGRVTKRQNFVPRDGVQHEPPRDLRPRRALQAEYVVTKVVNVRNGPFLAAIPTSMPIGEAVEGQRREWRSFFFPSGLSFEPARN